MVYLSCLSILIGNYHIVKDIVFVGKIEQTAIYPSFSHPSLVRGGTKPMLEVQNQDKSRQYDNSR